MPFFHRVLGLVLLSGHLVSCQLEPRAFSKAMPEPNLEIVQTQHGIASYYRDRRTASGEPFRVSALTAAHRTWPMGARVRVTHLGTGRKVIVRINDRGPHLRGRIIDLTPAAAEAIGLSARHGLAKVKLEQLK